MQIDKAEFLANLRLTQFYCAQQLRHTAEQQIAVLRSLNPAYGEGKLFRYVANDYPTNSGIVPKIVVEWEQGADPYNDEFMASIFEKQLNAKKTSEELGSTGDFRGEILVVEYDLNIADGAAAIESEGFVDNLDFPPIDTWFYRARNGDGWVLFTWVPEVFIELANEAVAVHFLDIIHWFGYWLPVEYRRLME